MADAVVSCPHCAATIREPLDRCPRCQTPLGGDDAVTFAATAAVIVESAGQRTRPPSSSTGWLSSSDAIDHGRFAPGTLLGGRFRIVGRLGGGGMGEVYRADDLKLGQPVALKFLPADFEADPARLMQLHGEVRMARQVAHPNVCRVYDIDEVEGTVCLSMEYIDGDDLASLIRRMGRFPVDRGVEIARQIAAGLAAAHERGVVHRDLKPANVMIDAAGKVRLTDFGLAGVSGQTVRAGTPAYMAPEQLAGQEVTPRSDIFALGLVLYELFTGRRALEAKTIAELIQKHDAGGLPPPSSIVPELTPDIDRAIMRCLQRNPAARPASALAVAAALPGGDPLAAALAAGETPSPELVAAAGGSEVMSRGAAVAAALFVGASLLAITAAYERSLLVNRVPLERSPVVLADRAQELIESLGYSTAGQSVAYGFGTAPIDHVLHVASTSQAPDRWSVLEHPWPPNVMFWYRTSPRPLVPLGGDARAGAVNPPLALSGQLTVVTDTTGRLAELHVIPPQVAPDTHAAAPTDWDRVFAAAGLSMAAFTEATPEWLPRTFADERRAWTGTHPAANLPVRVEAASYRGRPVYFSLIAPWSRPTRMATSPVGRFDAAINALAGLIMPGLIISAALLARRNLKLGRGDRRGAAEAAAVMFTVLIAGWLLTATYVADVALEVQRVFTAVGSALFSTAVLWLAYLGLEPFVRRYWPDSLITWSRVTTGQWDDPRVGRDVLLGICAGLAMTLAFSVHNLLPPLVGRPEPIPMARSLIALEGLRETLGNILLQIGSAVQAAMMGTIGVVLLLNLLKRVWLAAIVAVVVYAPVVIAGMFMPGTPILDLVIGGIITAIFVGVIIRLGLLASVAAVATHFVFLSSPLTTSLGSWRGSITFCVLALVGGTAFVSLWLARKSTAMRQPA